MLGKLKSLLQSTLGDTVQTEEDLEREVRLACAVLLVDAARADHEQGAEEMQTIERLLRERFELKPEESDALLKHANEELDHAVALQGFTRQLMDALTERERCDVVGMLWDVVYADGELHRWEEHLVRRVADLLYVPHVEFMRLKHEAKSRVSR